MSRELGHQTRQNHVKVSQEEIDEQKSIDAFRAWMQEENLAEFKDIPLTSEKKNQVDPYEQEYERLLEFQKLKNEDDLKQPSVALDPPQIPEDKGQQFETDQMGLIDFNKTSELFNFRNGSVKKKPKVGDEL